MVIGWGVDNKDTLSMLKLNINNINFVSRVNQGLYGL